MKNENISNKDWIKCSLFFLQTRYFKFVNLFLDPKMKGLPRLNFDPIFLQSFSGVNPTLISLLVAETNPEIICFKQI